MNTRFKLIKAIKSFCHSPKIVHYELIKMNTKELYFHLENHCLICRKDFKTMLNKYQIKGA